VPPRPRSRPADAPVRDTDAPVNEAAFGRAVLIGFSQMPHVRVWRQNVGTLPLQQPDGTVRVFRGGPPKGAADISGVCTDTGWRIECELKMSRGRRTKEQLIWENFIARSGGIYATYTYDAARTLDENVADACAALRAAIAARHAREPAASEVGSGGAARAQREAMRRDLARALGAADDVAWRDLIRQAAQKSPALTTLLLAELAEGVVAVP